MFVKKYNPYGLKRGSGMPIKYSSCPEEKEMLDKEYEQFIKAPENVKHSDELLLRKMIDDYEKKCKISGEGFKRSGEGLKRSGEGLTRSGGSIKRSGEGILRSGDGVLRSGDGLTVTGGIYTGSTVGTSYVGSGYKKGGCKKGGCNECMLEKKPPKGIGSDLKEEMLKLYSK